MTKILSFVIREYLADPKQKSYSWCDWVRDTFGEIGKYSRTTFHEFYHFSVPQYIIEGSIVTLIETTKAVHIEVLPLPGNNAENALEKITSTLAENHPNKENVRTLPFMVFEGGKPRMKIVNVTRENNTSNNNNCA